MMPERIGVYPPSSVKQILEHIGVREIQPSDLCRSSEQRDELYRRYPDLIGDQTAIDGFDENCQSWRDNPDWWKELLLREA